MVSERSVPSELKREATDLLCNCPDDIAVLPLAPSFLHIGWGYRLVQEVESEREVLRATRSESTKISGIKPVWALEIVADQFEAEITGSYQQQGERRTDERVEIKEANEECPINPVLHTRADQACRPTSADDPNPK